MRIFAKPTSRVVISAALAMGFLSLTAAPAGAAGVTNHVSHHSVASAVPVVKKSSGGKVSISGTKGVGKTLTANVSGLSLSKGVTLAYQWMRDGKNIANATGKSYKVVQADAGKTVKVKVTIKKSGETILSITSAAAKITNENTSSKASSAAKAWEARETEIVASKWDSAAMDNAKKYYKWGYSRGLAMYSLTDLDGFEQSQATNAVDSLGLDWRQNAAFAAKDCYEYLHYSRQACIDFLSASVNMFTREEAIWGVDHM